MARVGRITRVMRRRWIAVRRRRPEYLHRLVGQYHVGTLLLEEGRVPVRWFRKAANFGDAMSPWLISKMTGREVVDCSEAVRLLMAVMRGAVMILARLRDIKALSDALKLPRTKPTEKEPATLAGAKPVFDALKLPCEVEKSIPKARLS